MSVENLKVAVVGLGKMGVLHASILNVLPNVQLTALCDKSVMMRKFLKKVFKGIPIVDDIEKLSDLDLDAVYVTTPVPSHFPVARMLYLEKVARNLFVEKTLASSYDNAKELCELAQRFGGVNMVGYLRRFAVTFRKARNLLAQGALGELISFKAYAYSSDFYGVNESSRTSASRGGVLKDLGCHTVDLAIWFFGDLEVDSARHVSPNDSQSEDSVYFSVKKFNGLRGEFDISWCMKNYRMPEVGLSISGSKGIIEVNDDKVELRLNGESSAWYRQDLHDNVVFWLGGPEYFREDDYFVKSVRENSAAKPDFYAASKVDQIIDQVQHEATVNE